MATRGIGKMWAWVGALGLGATWGCGGAEAPRASLEPVGEVAPAVAATPAPGTPSGPETPALAAPASPDTTAESAPSARPSAHDSRRPWLRGSFFAGVAPESLAVADFDGDGAPDVAVGTRQRNAVYSYMTRMGELRVLRNTGGGQLTALSSRHPVHGPVGRVVAGDADGDGRQDVLVGTLVGYDLLRGQGDGSLREKPYPIIGRGVHCGGAVYSLGVWRSDSGAPRVWSVGSEHEWTSSSVCMARPLEGTRFEMWNPVEPRFELELGALLSRATLADFNEDGFADLMFGTEQALIEGKARLFLGDASERLLPGPSFPMMPSFERVESADLNRDGHVDLLGLKDNTLWVFLGSGRGSFTQASTFPLPLPTRELAVVELDGDGLPDVVALHAQSAEVSLLHGTRQGVLHPWGRLAVGRRPSGAAAADLNGDGVPELVVAEADDNTVSVYALPERPVTELPRPVTCPVAPESPRPAPLPAVAPLATLDVGGGAVRGVVGDFDGDGREDLALALATGGVSVVPHAGEEGLMSWPVWAVKRRAAISLVAGDFDGDGRVDLAGRFRAMGQPGNEPEYDTLLLWNEGQTSFSVSAWGPRWWTQQELLAGDFNGDGRVDLAHAHMNHYGYGSSGFRLTSLGRRDFQEQHLEDHSPPQDDNDVSDEDGRPLAADFNGDGTLDLVHLSQAINIDFTAADGSTLPGGQGFNYHVPRDGFFGATDVDGDGVPDLVADSSTGQVSLMRGDGHGSIQSPLECTLPAGDRVLAWEDLNANGTADLVSISEGGRRLWVVARTQDGRWAAPRAYDLDSPARWVRSVDLLGDARPELAVMLQSGQLRVFPTP